MGLSLKGQPKFACLKKDEAGGTPAVRGTPSALLVSLASRRPCPWVPVPISAAPLGHDSFCPDNPGQAWPFKRRPPLGHIRQRFQR